MSDLKPTGVKIKLGNEEYGMRFTLNAIDDIQDHFNIDISELNGLFSDTKHQIRNIRYILTVLINEDIDCVADETGEKRPHVDEKFVGRHIDIANINSVIGRVYATVNSGTPEASEEDSPNATSE